MEILNILRIYFKHILLPLWYRKITLMKFFFSKVTGCHLTRKDFITVSFGWIFGTFQIRNQRFQFFLFLYQFSNAEQYSQKSFQESWENKCHVFLVKLQVLRLLKKRLHNSFLWVNILWNFSDQLFSKTASGESFCYF